MPSSASSARVPSALSAVLDLLQCPRCGEQLAPADGSLRCPARHTFDVARAGYVSLLTGAAPTSGDDAEMARARDRFLGSGTYAPVREAIAQLSTEAMTADAGMHNAHDLHAAHGNTVPKAHSPAVLDAGCGTGYYLAGVLDHIPAARGLGLDTSTRALRFAAHAHERAAAATWDVFKPFPLRDRSADVLLNVFAPRNPAEFARVLRPGGVLVVARPTPCHLAELLAQNPGSISVDPNKEQRLHRALDPHFTAVREERVEYVADLNPAQAADLLAMTPSARHVEAGESTTADQRASGITTTVSVLVSAYTARS